MIARMREPGGPGWGVIQVQAHLPEVQELVRQEIRKGTIRVVPGEGDGIRIVPGLQDPEDAHLVFPVDPHVFSLIQAHSAVR